MSGLSPHHNYSFDEYLELEQDSPVRHEFYAGEIYAMAGGTPEHAAMAAAVNASNSDLRLRVLTTGLATYPDATVICGASERDPESPTHVTNPTVILEVLSPSTAHYDRGQKLQHYQRIPSLSAVVLVDYREPSIELWLRQDGAWQQTGFGAGDRVPLASTQCSLSVDAVYAAARDA